MALTLLEASKLKTGDVVRDTVVEMFAMSSELLSAGPWMNIPGGSYHYNQEGSLPGVAFRGLNEGYSESTGIINPQIEVLRIGGGDLDVDKALLDMNGEELRGTHEMLKIKAMSLYIAKKIVKGDSLADVREFDGLQNRIRGSQLIAAGATSGGDALSLGKLDELIDAVDNPTHLIMSKAMRRKMAAAARNTSVGGDIEFDIDDLGRRVTFYNSLPIIIADYDDDGDRIIDFDEANPGGGSAVGTSIYCVSFGDSMLTGLQNGEMQVRDLGELESKPVFRTRIEWYVGLAALHGRCAARLWGVKDAAVVA